MSDKRHWFETKHMKLINKQIHLKSKASFTVGSGNQRRDNDILLTLSEDGTFQIELKFLESKTKSGNIVIKMTDWNHLDQQAGGFNIPVLINGHSKLELASMKPSDLYAIIANMEGLRTTISELRAEVITLEQELEDSDAV